MTFLKGVLIAALTWLGFGLSPQEKAEIMMEAFLNQCVASLERGEPINFDGFNILPDGPVGKDAKVTAFGVSHRSHISMSSLKFRGLVGCTVEYEFTASGNQPFDAMAAASIFENWISERVSEGRYVEMRRCVSGRESYQVTVESKFPRDKPIRVFLYFKQDVPLYLAVAAEIDEEIALPGC